MTDSIQTEITETQPDFTAKATIAGHEVSLACYQNRKKKNQDRAGIVSMEGIASGSFAEAMDEAIATMARETLDKKADNGYAWATSENGTTIAAAAYDPTHESLYVRTRGDAPVYLVFSDGKNNVAVDVTYPLDHVENVIANALSHRYGNPNSPGYKEARAGVYDVQEQGTTDIDELKLLFLNGGNAHDPIQIDTLKQEIVQKHKLEKDKITVTLVAGSDALSKGYKLGHNCEDTAWLHEFFDAFTPALGKPNPADHIAQDIVTKKRTADNTTVAVIPLQKGGGPIGVIVADGFQPLGEQVAQAATDSFINAVQHLRGQEADTKVPPAKTTVIETTPQRLPEAKKK